VAVIARLDMPAQCGGPAGGDGTQDALLLAGQVLQAMAVTFDDIRQFQRGALERRSHGIVETGC
jgi:hypothetical protein